MRYTLLVCLLLVCAPAGVAAPGTSLLFRDIPVNHGFRLSAVESSMRPVEIATVIAAAPNPEPQWRLAQWGTRFSLAGADEQTSPDGTRILANEGKTVKLFPGGLGGEGVLLAVDGGAEYGGKLRQRGEPWPHLLVEQSFPSQERLNQYRALRFHIEFQVGEVTPAVDAPLDPGLHTAHITAFWTIHNRNPGSPDYGDMIWFGIPLYDARHPIPPGHQALDVGKNDATGKFICTLEGSRFHRESTGNGAWHTIDCDLLPLIREALAASQNHGHLTESRFEDLAATSFNCGWEVPGPYRCAIHLRRLRLEALR